MNIIYIYIYMYCTSKFKGAVFKKVVELSLNDASGTLRFQDELACCCLPCARVVMSLVF